MGIFSIKQQSQLIAQIKAPSMRHRIERNRVFFGFIAVLVLSFGFTTPVSGQEESGVIFPNRLGISYQKALGVDIGLIAFNQWNDDPTFTFYDFSLGVESFISKPFIMAPKFSFDFGFGDIFTLGGGLDVSMPTDFSRVTWMLTPKAGISLASMIRLYYGRHIFQQEAGFPNLGKHRISFEINIAAFHDFKIGL